MPSKKQHLHQYTTNIAQVLRNKFERAKATYIIKNDGAYFVNYKGAVLTPEQFEEMLPISVHSVGVKGQPISAHQKLVA
jgi:hypothetical protein